MPFLGERISEEDGKKMRWEQYPEYQNPWKAHPDVWAIDRELDVFIWRIKGHMPGWPDQIFGLYWKREGGGRVGAIETLTVTPDTDGKLTDVSWDIKYIRLPASLESERSLIESTIKDAFEAFSKRRSRIVNVRVSIR